MFVDAVSTGIDVLSTGDFQAVASTVIISAFAVWLLVRRPLDVPPGPRWRTPILGNLREFASHFGLKATLRGLRSTYGDIYSLFLGRQLVVIVNGQEAIRRLLKKDEQRVEKTDIFGGIPMSGKRTSKMKKNQAIFNQALDTVLGEHQAINERISDSTKSFIEAIDDQLDDTFDPAGLVSRCTTELVWSVLWNVRTGDDTSPEVEQLASQCEELSNLRGHEVLMQLVPAIRYIPSERGRCRQIDNLREKIYDVFEREMQETNAGDNLRENDVLTTYKRLLNTGADGKPIVIEDSKLCMLIVSVYLNLTKSLTTMIYSAVWFLMTNQDLQKQLRKAISQPRGNKKRSRMKTSVRLDDTSSFIEAFVLETKRFVKMNSMLDYSRKTTADTRLLGYGIPSNTLVLADMESLMTDPILWNDPFEFKPERFLTKDGYVSKDTYGLKYLRDTASSWETFTETATRLYIAAILENFYIDKPSHAQLDRYDKNTKFTASFVPRFSDV